MPVFIVVVHEEFQIDAKGKEIPETRVKQYCVKNDVTNETIQCFDDPKDAIELCEEKNNQKPKQKTTGGKKIG